MRGFDAILVEKRDLTHGTTGRYHGLLHSGARYVVKDPDAAVECIQENRILRRIMPHCIEDTGGFFVLTPEDDPDYVPRFLEGCHRAGIPVEEVPIRQMLKEEPALNPAIRACFRVPDASADSFLAADANAQSAREHGARIWTYHEVQDLLVDRDRVVGALCRDLVKDEDVLIYADMVVNAAGAWAGKIAALAGITVHVVPGKGIMVAVAHRVVNTVINRCKMPSDGDILVPAHTVAIIGTTDVKVDDPEHFAVEPWEVRLMLDEAEKMVPGFRHLRILRTWAGVRPLYQETAATDTRDITRAFALLDHETRDGLAGLITITGGKWTTYRLMAEVTVDKVCEKLGVSSPCRTAEEPLPGAEKAHYHRLGVPLARVEGTRAYGDLICECELATRADVVRAIVENDAKTIDDIRRDTRLGMGPCQGGFCTYRAVGLLHALRHPAVEDTNVALKDFLRERWKGLVPVLWGQQVHQERLDELIYLSLLNSDHMPGPAASRLTPTLYDTPTTPEEPIPVAAPPKPPLRPGMSGHEADVLVIGAGLAGLFTAWRAAREGLNVRVVTKGWGALYWHAGTIDVLGYYPESDPLALESPRAGIERLIADQPDHPYAQAGLDALAQALADLQALCADAGYPLHGSLDRNWLLPSAVGAFRPTCLAPATMTAGDLRRRDPMLIVGFAGYHDFFPDLIADNLTAQDVLARGVTLDLPALRRERIVNTMTLARLFERADFRQEVVRALKPKVGRAARVGFPAVLGLDNALAVKRDLEERLGREVFEIPTLPPSIPGMRLHRLLVGAIRRAGGRVFDGMEAVRAEVADGRVVAVWTEAAARWRVHRARTFVLATGGFLGGGLWAAADGTVREPIFGLPVVAPQGRLAWFHREFFAPEGHPLWRAGIPTDKEGRPVDARGQVVYENLYVIGNQLGRADAIRQRALEGIALVGGGRIAWE